MPARHRRNIGARLRRFSDNRLLLRIAPLPPCLGNHRITTRKIVSGYSHGTSTCRDQRVTNKSYIHSTAQGGPRQVLISLEQFEPEDGLLCGYDIDDAE
jgi:hypothetical protein